MNTKKHVFLFLLGTFFLNSCSDMTAKEILRVKMSRPGDLVPKQKSVRMEKGDEIAIWSDMDFSHIGSSVKMEVQLELYLRDTLYETIEFSPTNKSITLNEVKVTEGSRTNWKFSGKNEEIVIKEDGSYKCIAHLKTSSSSIKLDKAEVVLKRKKRS